ncbi:TPA: hypothetical protein ACKRG6_003475 [Proteus mirabilis]
MNKHIYIKFIENDEIIFYEKINIENNFDKAKYVFDKIGFSYQLCAIDNHHYIESEINPENILFQTFIVYFLYSLSENIKNIWKNCDVENVFLYFPIDMTGEN